MLAFWVLLTKICTTDEEKWIYAFILCLLEQIWNIASSFSSQQTEATRVIRADSICSMSRGCGTRALSSWRQYSLHASAGKLARILNLLMEVHGRWVKNNKPKLKEGSFQISPRKEIVQECPLAQWNVWTGCPEICKVFAMGFLKTELNKARSILV